jgi:Flp pilus assembly protein TadG
MIHTARAGVGRLAHRRGTIVTLLALTLVALMAFLALAIDLGMLAIAKTQAQQAADLAALTAARTLNGDATDRYNSSAATINAQNIMTYNYILGQQVLPANKMVVSYGSYDYSPTTQSFSTNFPATSGVPYTAVSATVTTISLPGAFSTVLGSQFLPNVSATAQAVHRPRDIGLAMDLSSSMRYGSLLGFDMVQARRTTNNPDTVVPTFGHYSSTNAVLTGPTTDRTSAYGSYTVTPSNATAGNTSYTLTYINGFFQNDAFAPTLIRAFDSYTSSDGGKSWSSAGSGAKPSLPPSSYATTPGGDVPLYAYGSSSAYATTLSDALGSSSANILWELDGYSAFANGKPDTSGSGGVPAVWTKTGYGASSVQFKGYTQGPGYYGKTFFVWPPDPRNTNTPSGTALTDFLNALGVTDPSDQSYLSSMWSTWQAQGTRGVTHLKNWLTGNSTSGGPYTVTGPYVPGSGNNAPIYYAVCRLFNRAYPAGRANPSFSADWRLRFFGTNDNTALFSNVSGSMNRPGRPGTYTINYNEILAWLAKSPNPFPTQMRAGRIKYYGSIPTSITGTWPDYGGTDERFWVEVIDYMLGFRQTAAGLYSDVSAMAGYGGDFTWGPRAITAPPNSGTQYMQYNNNPARPLLRYWFSPILMVDYLHNYNLYQNMANYYIMQPGDSYEAPIYTAREAFQASINTMKANHPNDYFSLVLYSRPRSSSKDSLNRFNCVHCPLGTNYDYATASLFFPFSTFNADGSSNGTEITPYDADPATGAVPSANFSDTPRAKGGTCFAMALMLCYNQFAVTPLADDTLRNYVSNAPIAFPNGMAGGMGRRGAQKVIIFETDGIPECRATANLVNAGSYSYYQVRYDMNRPTSSEYPSVVETTDADPIVTSQIYTLIDELNTTYGTTRNPFKLYAIGFGPVFDGPDAKLGLSVLQTMQYHGNTQSSASTSLPSYQIITGTDAQMSANLVSAYTNILQNGVQIALIK